MEKAPCIYAGLRDFLHTDARWRQRLRRYITELLSSGEPARPVTHGRQQPKQCWRSRGNSTKSQIFHPSPLTVKT